MAEMMDEKLRRRAEEDALAVDVIEECRVQLMLKFRFLDRALWRMGGVSAGHQRAHRGHGPATRTGSLPAVHGRIDARLLAHGAALHLPPSLRSRP